MKTNLFVIFGIVGILTVLILGCTAESTRQYEQAPTQETPAAAAPSTEIETPKVVPIPELASAMEWYPVAEAEALRWRTDAKLIEVSGDNRDGKNYLPVDGKAKRWTYSFVSVVKLTKYRITVEKGGITDKNIYDEPLAKAMYDNSPTSDRWLIDSTSAVNNINTNANGKDFINTVGKIRANYLLKFEGTGSANPITWTIGYFPENYGQNLITNVNGETGRLI